MAFLVNASVVCWFTTESEWEFQGGTGMRRLVFDCHKWDLVIFLGVSVNRGHLCFGR